VANTHTRAHTQAAREITRLGPENRWSQFFYRGSSGAYVYSGLKNKAHAVETGSAVDGFIDMANRLMTPLPAAGGKMEGNGAAHFEGRDSAASTLEFVAPEKEEGERSRGDGGGGAYNSALVNWYEPSHTIGSHADDEINHHLPNYPIFSFSAGGTRRFCFHPIKGANRSARSRV